MDFFRKKLLTYKKHFVILSLVARERTKNPEEMRYAEVSELADEHFLFGKPASGNGCRFFCYLKISVKKKSG